MQATQYSFNLRLPQVPSTDDQKLHSLLLPLHNAVHNLAFQLDVYTGRYPEPAGNYPILGTENINSVSFNKLYAQAGEIITEGSFVYFADSGSGGVTAKLAVASGATTLAQAVYTGSSALSIGDWAEFILSPTVRTTVSLTPGTPYYLDPATPGAYTSTPPTTAGQYVQPLAFALSATELYINICCGGPVSSGGGGGGITLSQAWPVGSIHISVNSANPSTYFGGTWVAFGTGQVLIGIDAGDADFTPVGKTGGAKAVSSTVVDTLSVDAVAAHTHSVTSAVSVADHSVTQPTLSTTSVADHAAHTHSVTSAVSVADHSVTQPTISGAAVADHAAHTHSVTSNVSVADHASHTHTYTDIVNHTHPHNIQGGTTAATTGTNVMASTATGGSARAMAIATSNPTGGVASGTTAGPSATLTHTATNNAVTSGNPSATLTHTVTQPTASGSAVSSHSVTNTPVTSGNPSATLTHTVTQPTASGTAVSSHSVTNSAVTSNSGGGHTHSLSGAVSASGSVVQPYIVVYMWKRTA